VFNPSGFLISWGQSCDYVLDSTTMGGGALRTIKVDSLILQVTCFKFQVTLEIQDKNDGQDTDKIDVYVSFKDNSPENGSNQN
jgi:hypothetical protein